MVVSQASQARRAVPQWQNSKVTSLGVLAHGLRLSWTQDDMLRGWWYGFGYWGIFNSVQQVTKQESNNLNTIDDYYEPRHSSHSPTHLHEGKSISKSSEGSRGCTYFVTGTRSQQSTSFHLLGTQNSSLARIQLQILWGVDLSLLSWLK